VIRPFVQGDPKETDIVEARRSVVLLGISFVAAATLVVAVASEIGRMLGGGLPDGVVLAVVTVSAAVGVAVDIRSSVTGGLAPGISRQTAERLPHVSRGPGWVVPVLWGLDTGLVLTTFRVSFASYLMLILALAGLMPVWAGAAYGLAFALPLAVAIVWRRGPHVETLGGAGFRGATRIVQVLAASVMTALLVTSIAVWL
jgi:hypothetical protein